MVTTFIVLHVLRALTVLWTAVLLWRLRESRVWFWGAISLIGAMLMAARYFSSTTDSLVSPPAEEMPALLLISITRLVVVVLAERALAGRKRAATKLEATQNLHRHLVEDSLGLMCVHDLNGVMQSINPSAAQSLGYRPEDGIGRNMRQFLAPSARHEFDSYLHRIRRNGTASGLMRLVARDGGERIWSYRNVLYEEPGAPARVFGHAQDVTEHKRAEEALRESEQRFDLAVKGTSDGIWDLNVITGENYWSPRLYELLGYEVEEIEVSLDAFKSHLHPDDRAYALEALRVHLEDRVPYDIEYRLRTKSGEYRWFRARGQAVWDETGTAVRMAGSIQDITDRKEAEQKLRAAHDELEWRVQERTKELEDANAALQAEIKERQQAEELLGNSEADLRRSSEKLRALTARLITAQEEQSKRISRELHDDFNQKIAALVIGIETIEKHMPQSAKTLSAQLTEQRRQAETLSDDIRRVAHALHPSVLDHLGLVVALESYCAEFTQKTGTKTKFSHRNIRRGLPKDVALCVYRVVQESLRNVMKHSAAKQAEVSVTEIKGHVCLAVSDDGVGFDTELQSGKRGIGLTSMEERVRLVSGSFSVQSRPGEGTRVDISIPLPKPPASAVPSESEQTVMGPRPVA